MRRRGRESGGGRGRSVGEIGERHEENQEEEE